MEAPRLVLPLRVAWPLLLGYLLAGISLAHANSSSNKAIDVYNFSTAPRGVHIAYGENPSQMVVSWLTFAPTQHPIVEFQPTSTQASAALLLTLLGRKGAKSKLGFGSQSPVSRVTAAVKRFTDAGELQTQRWLYTAVLDGLDRGAEYSYRVGDDEGWSEYSTFRAMRSPDDIAEHGGLQLLVYGDMGLDNAQALRDIVKEAGTGEYDAVLHVGDIGYDLYEQEGGVADAFVESIQPIAARVPYMVSPGNHERTYNFSHYRAYFNMPQRQSYDNLYYSWDIGPVHFVSYNTEVFFFPDLFSEHNMKRQYEWMEADLQAANRNRQERPWIIVVGHRPMYCASCAYNLQCDDEHEMSRLGVPLQEPCQPGVEGCPSDGKTGSIQLTFPMEKLFHKYGVDMAIFGHKHWYERFYPVYDKKVIGHPGGSSNIQFDMYASPRSTVHITTGAAGNREMKIGTKPPPSGRCSSEAPWCAFESGYNPSGKCGESSDYSFSKVNVVNRTHLHWVQWSSTRRKVIDDFWLVQHSHAPFDSIDSSDVEGPRDFL
eukprot:jgi/Chlat1/4161/Chrsp27S04232